MILYHIKRLNSTTNIDTETDGKVNLYSDSIDTKLEIDEKLIFILIAMNVLLRNSQQLMNK